MAKKGTEALREQWQALDDDPKLMLQILAALSDKGVEDAALIGAAAAFTEDPFIEFRLKESLWQLQADAETWFVQSKGPGVRKLRANARKAINAWQDETPHWPMLHTERLFDAISLMARDDLQSALDNIWAARAFNKQKYIRQLEFLYPELLQLRAAEAAALLALYYGFDNNRKKYAAWREAFSEWVEHAPLPQTPLLFLGILPDVQRDGAGYDFFRHFQINKQETMTAESEPEAWDAARAEALAEYLRGVTPGDQASDYCALTLRALAARPAWYSSAPPDIARERLGDYGPVINRLPVLPDPPFDKGARRQSMMLDLFAPLAARIEDYFGETGPGCRYVCSAVGKLRVAFNHHEDEDESLAFRYRTALEEIRFYIEADGDFNCGWPLIPFDLDGGGAEVVRTLRAAYPDWLGRRREKLDQSDAKTLEKQAAALRGADAPDELAQRLEAAFKFIGPYHQPANRRYFFALADQILSESKVNLMDLPLRARKLRTEVGFEIAKVELLLDPEAGFELARGFAEWHGAESPEARAYMLTRLAEFCRTNGFPGRARRVLAEWQEHAAALPDAPELRARRADVMLFRAECLAETGRAAETADEWQAAVDFIGDQAPRAETPAAAIALGWKLVGAAKRAGAVGAAPELREALAAVEDQIMTFEAGAAAIPGLRARVYLEMSDNPRYNAGAIQNGLISAGAFIKDEWEALLEPGFLRARPLSGGGDDMLLAGNRYLGVLNDDLFHKYAARRPIRVLFQALIAVAATSRTTLLFPAATYADDGRFLEERLRQSARAREKAAMEMRRGWSQSAKDLEQAIQKNNSAHFLPDPF